MDARSMLGTLKRTARRSKSLLIAFMIYKNWQTRRRFSRGQIESFHGSTHANKSLDESLSYIEEQFRDYLRYGSIGTSEVRGKRILELGFGDNLGVGLMFLAAGADQVVGIDKFYSARNESYELAVYTALRERLNEKEKQLFDDAISLEGGITLNDARLKRINGIDVETAIRDLSELKSGFDLIVSRAVIEEIYQPDTLFRAIDRVLKPGGSMLHKIDLSDYGMFGENGMHPLTFLTISEPCYRLMASDSGIPNRKRMGYYQRQVKELKYSGRFFITSILGLGTIEPHKETVKENEDYSTVTLDLIHQIRPKLDESFKGLTDEELMVEGIFLIGQKPHSDSIQGVSACL